MIKLIQLKLKVLAKIIVARYKPDIIGVTGSVGKTSTKEAVYTVLKEKYHVRRSIKNYNNELGVPLTIIGSRSPGRSLFGWMLVFIKAGKLIVFKDKNYPQILVLELGVDKPGDMDYLNSIVQCDIGILTAVSSVHLEYFSSRQQLAGEKAKLIKAVKPAGWSIINHDQELTRQAGEVSQAKVISYGLEEQADVRAEGLKFSFQNKGSGKNLQGVDFNLAHEKKRSPVRLGNVLGYGAVYSALAGAAVGFAYGMSAAEITRSLEEYRSPQGRMNLVKGIKHTMIIDDTYNAEPQSMAAALGILKQIPLPPGKRKFAVLGDMLELGSYSEEGHRNIGKYVYKSGVDKLIVVGERARDIARGAEEAGLSRDFIFYFANSDKAGIFVQDRIREGDLILVKGSQGIRMEKVVKEIMAEPLRAGELLVRQEEKWLQSQS